MLLEYMGLSRRYVKDQQRFAEQQRLRLPIDRDIGPVLDQSNGHGQGDSFAVLACSAYMAVWTLSIQSIADVCTGGFYDDSHYLCTNSSADIIVSKIQAAKQLSDSFDEVTGQKTNLTKTGVTSNDEELSKALVSATGYQAQSTVILLGGAMSFTDLDAFSWFETRFNAALNVLTRVTHMPTSPSRKQTIVEVAGTSKLYAIGLVDIPWKKASEFNYSATTAIFGKLVF